MFKKILMATVGVAAFIVIAAEQAEKPITDEQAIALTKQTVADIQKDTPGTFAKINVPEHPYRDKDNPALYVMVYDTEVNIVAHAGQATLIGKNFKGKPDVKGKKFRDEMQTVAKAKPEGGWVEYSYQKPGETGQTGIFPKTTFVMLAKGTDGKEYVVGVGKYSDKK